jgi:hypothetical protein
MVGALLIGGAHRQMGSATARLNTGSSPCPPGEPSDRAVVEFRSAAVGVAGDPLSSFKGAVIFQKFVILVARN